MNEVNIAFVRLSIESPFNQEPMDEMTGTWQYVLSGPPNSGVKTKMKEKSPIPTWYPPAEFRLLIGRGREEGGRCPGDVCTLLGWVAAPFLSLSPHLSAANPA